MNPIIYIASITHRHGVNTYAALTEAGLNRQLADYARTHWSEAFPEGCDNDPSAGDVDLTEEQIWRGYFDVMGDFGEYADTDTTELTE